MSRYLLQISIGPVQGFIAAARRTRDLWLGSYILSEVSKAAAGAIRDCVKCPVNGELIFPYSDDIAASLAQGDGNFNVGNVILAEVEGEDNAKAASTKAKEASEQKWNEFVEEARGKLEKYIDEGRWEYQKTGVIEFYSAWGPIKDDYSTARRNVDRLLAARKKLRDFEQWSGESVPKSSLDGMRESVLRDHSKHKSVNGVQIKSGEALDLVGCVKRAAGGVVRFPSVTRVAIDPWVRGFRLKYPDDRDFDKIISHCEELNKLGVLNKAAESGFEDVFPFEGTALLPNRYGEFEVLEGDELTEIKKITDEMRKIMSALFKKHKNYDPYLAILSADGDRMGRAISSLDSAKDHRIFSKTLSAFAEKARETVAKHYGVCVYAGGDDVLAFLPSDKAIACARALYNDFGDLWTSEISEEIKAKLTPPPTLSVGVAIGHAMEDLESLLGFAREAERMAKNGYENDDVDSGKIASSSARNSLAVTVRARGNSELSARGKWTEGSNAGNDNPEFWLDKPLDRRLDFWAKCFKELRIPARFPYELRNAARYYENWKDETTIGRAMQNDVLRIFRRKDVKLSDEEKTALSAYVRRSIAGSWKSVSRMSDEMIIGRWIGEAQASAAPSEEAL